MEIYYTPNFTRASHKLLGEMKIKAEEAINIFRADIDDPRLRLHKLHGRFRNCWAFSVDYKYRIIFRYGKDDEVILITVGDHDIYD
jgi:mRNA-degrading endonuclease YafQ of YafQ-DinJ toxin-antitoxin module